MTALRVFRPLNLGIIALLQLLTFYYLNLDSGPEDLDQPWIWLIVGASVLISAAGYLFNDLIDRSPDAINKPDKLFIERWPVWLVWTIFILFNAGALIMLYIVSQLLVVWFSVVIFVMIIYSLILKRLPMIGNLAVSALAAFSVYVVYLSFGEQDKYLVIFYAGFAALLTYLRELVKDIEDIEGDKESGYYTFPVLLGIEQSKTLVSMSVGFILMMYGYMLWTGILFSFFSGPLLYVFGTYHLICVVLPLIYFLVLSIRAESKGDFTRLSRLAKYIMATGILSMMFF